MDKLVASLKRQLGGSILDVNISDNDIKGFIEQALEEATPYISATQFMTVNASSPVDLRDRQIQDVVRVFSGHSMSMIDPLGFGVVEMKGLLQAQMHNYLMSELSYAIDQSFRYIDGWLYLDNYTGNVTIEYIPSNILPCIEGTFHYNWVRRYALALCKETIGRIRSKFQASGLPVTLDGENILREGLEEKATLYQELQRSGSVLTIR